MHCHSLSDSINIKINNDTSEHYYNIGSEAKFLHFSKQSKWKIIKKKRMPKQLLHNEVRNAIKHKMDSQSFNGKRKYNVNQCNININCFRTSAADKHHWREQLVTVTWFWKTECLQRKQEITDKTTKSSRSRSFNHSH